MPNHVDSTMKLTFENKKDKDLFMFEFTQAKQNLCATVMPIVNIQPLDKDGNKPLGIKIGEHWANMTMPDGSIIELRDLAWSDELWGTKWGTYSVEIYETEDTYVAMDFDTAWSPISETCILAIIDKYNFVNMDYSYKDEGLAFTGAMAYDKSVGILNTI